MILNRTVDPSGALVSTADAKTHLRVDGSDEDVLIDALVAVATNAVEEMTGRALLTQTWKMRMPRPSGEVRLPKTPAASLSSVAYFDRDEVEQTATLGDFLLLAGRDKATVRPASGADWPEAYDRPDAVSITWVAGYGAAADVPAELVHAVKLMLGHLFEHREAVSAGVTMTETPIAVDHLVGLHRVGWIA